MAKPGFFGVYMMGGLGNQIFQYLFALNLQQKFDIQTLLMMDWYLINHLTKRNPNRELLLSRLNGIKLQLTTLGLAVEANINFPIVYRYEEQGGLASWPTFATENILSIGYYQSVESMPSTVDVLDFLDAQKPLIKRGEGTTVSIHVRIGDYKYTNNVLPVLPISYYVKALAAVKQADRFLVFSEDIEEARHYFSELCLTYPLEFQTPQSPLDDFFSIASANCVIGANSTYSLLAGLLAMRAGAEVLMPHGRYWHGANFQVESRNKAMILAQYGLETIA